jgi:hypothetical protein
MVTYQPGPLCRSGRFPFAVIVDKAHAPVRASQHHTEAAARRAAKKVSGRACSVRPDGVLVELGADV